jgi:hypothetical protein
MLNGDRAVIDGKVAGSRLYRAVTGGAEPDS